MGAGISLFNIIIIALRYTCDRLKVKQENNTDGRWTANVRGEKIFKLGVSGNTKVRCVRDLEHQQP